MGFKDEVQLSKMVLDINHEALEKNFQRIKSGKLEQPNVRVVSWILPPVTHALKGGVRTAFIFAQELTLKHGTLNNIIIYSHFGKPLEVDELSKSLKEHFPCLRFVISVFLRGDNPESLPHANVSICTLWTTAYLQVLYNKVSRKFYLVQDYEPYFYSAGSISGLIEQTYRFGFSCLANTHGVGSQCKIYTSDVTTFSPGIDRNIFYAKNKQTRVEPPYKVVFYGRPSNPRNCFSLGIQTLKSLKRKMKDNVQIISVGEEYNLDEYGLKDILENHGLLNSLDEVANLYRDCCLGLVYMMTPHPSYQPLEYMATGCITATNYNENNSWLLNNDNSLLLNPIPEISAEQICRLLVNSELKQKIINKAFESIENLSWSKASAIVCKRLLQN